MVKSGLEQSQKIFRTYDIRGVVDNELTVEIAHLIGYHFGLIALKRHQANHNQYVCVGYDGRLSSPKLYNALVSGLHRAAIPVISVGCGPTPYLYYCDRQLKPIASIMITGSHNEAPVNGFKLVLNHQPFWGDDIETLYDELKNSITDINFDDFNNRLNVNSELLEIQNLTASYIKFLVKDFKTHYAVHNNLKIVWDPGNGAAGEIIEKVVVKLPGEHCIINAEIDGKFPNHHPDPTITENLQQLITAVVKTNSDFGIAFDGDGDRIGVVSSTGRILSGECLLEILAQEVLETHPQSYIIADIKTSETFFESIKSMGGVPLLWKTGHSAIKAKMLELKALFAAEMSGHIFFADRYYGYDDAIYASLRFIGAIHKYQIDIEQWLVQRPILYSTPELRVDCYDKFKVVDYIKKYLEEAHIQYNNLDGVRVVKVDKDCWWLIRAAHTQEVLVIKAEAKDPLNLIHLIDQIIELLSPFNLELNHLKTYRDKLTA